jgi:hypothetical protein
VTSRPWPRRCGGPCWCCPAGSPAPGGGGGCTCPPACRGRTRSPWRWRGCAASRTPPDHPPTPRLGWSAACRPLRRAATASGEPLSRATTSSPPLTRHVLRLHRHSMRTPERRPPERVRKPATAFANRWIRAELHECLGWESKRMHTNSCSPWSAPHMLAWHGTGEELAWLTRPRARLLARGSVLRPRWPGAHRGTVEAGFVGEDHRLDPVAKLQLHQDPLHMGPDRRLLHGQRGGDLAVR